MRIALAAVARQGEVEGGECCGGIGYPYFASTEFTELDPVRVKVVELVMCTGDDGVGAASRAPFCGVHLGP